MQKLKFRNIIIAVCFLGITSYSFALPQQKHINVFELAVKGTPQQLKDAVKNGANFNIEIPSFESESQIHIDIEALEWIGEQATPLHYAASYNRNPKSIKFLISLGLNVNKEFFSGNTIFGNPISCAVRNQNIEAIYELLKAGANPDSYSNDGNYTYGTLLHVIAIQYKNNYPVTKNVINALIKAGANINYHEKPDKEYYEYYSDIFLAPRNQWENNYPFENVVNASHAGLVSFLSSFTPLMYAVLCDNADVVNILLDNKANANIRNVEKKTALDYARELPRNSSIKKTSTFEKLKKATKVN